MRKIIVALLLAAAPAGLVCAATKAVPASVATAIAAPARDADRKDDERRHGAEIVAFAGVKPGMTVVDLLPGAGYWSRIFSGVVGPKGKVYADYPASLVKPGSRTEAAMKALTDRPGFTNVEPTLFDLAAFRTAQPVDVVFTSQNLHDVPNKSFGSGDITAFSKAVYDALKPGGRFIVIDHVAAPGAGLTVTDTLHRIEPATARKLVEAAGFRFVGMSNVLKHPADDHTLNVFDPSLRGNTDQFAYAFEKPRR